MHELVGADVLLVEDADHLLHVLTHRAALQELGSLRNEIFARVLQHLPFEHVLVELQISLLLVVLHHHEAVDHAVDGFDIFGRQVALHAIPLDAFQNLLHQRIAEILNHEDPPDVQAQFADLHLLLRHRQVPAVAVQNLSLRHLLFLDVLLI